MKPHIQPPFLLNIPIQVGPTLYSKISPRSYSPRGSSAHVSVEPPRFRPFFERSSRQGDRDTLSPAKKRWTTIVVNNG